MRVFIVVFFIGLFSIPGFAQKKTEVECEKFYKLINEEENALILDIRPIEMYENNRIKNALWAGEKDSLFILLKDVPRQTTLLLYCKIGKRSNECAKLLKNRGYRKAYELKGGLKEWIREGYPVENIIIKN
ncbi:rhodanese-like domain-containing protein [Labilibacter marinus]|uniref:rhodanese-like domain-containing protein n=1 Tax=Labilibacter marinus TaxID=1477105 RepID=UPI00094FA031|nr:rhodanese-like domain-containing protein [Labilibacter marinus]